MSNVFYKYGLTPKEALEQKKLQKQFIKAEIAQNIRDMERVKENRATDGQILGTVEKFEKPLSERIKDRNLQRNQAQTLLDTIFEDSDEAKKALEQLSDDEIVKLNRYGPSVRRNILEQFENIDSDFFITYLRNYLQAQQQSKNLLNYYYPVSAKIAEEEAREERVTGSVNYEPFKGKLTKPLLKKVIEIPQDLTNMDIDKLVKKFEKAKQVRDKVVLEIKEFEKSKKASDAKKVSEYEDWLSKFDVFEQFVTEQLEDEMRIQEQNEGIPGSEEFLNVRTPTTTTSNTPEDIPMTSYLERAGFEPFQGDIFYDPREETSGMGLFKKAGFKKVIGSGVRMKPFKRVIFGRGLALEEPVEKYVSFGKFILNYPHLEEGYLHLKYPSMGPLPFEELKRKLRISDQLKNFIIDMLNKKKISKAKFTALNTDDKALIKKILEISKLNKTFIIKEGKGLMEDEDMKNFNVILGEIKAGNTNTDLKRQLVLLLSKFTLEGRINKEEGNEIIRDLLE